MHRIVYFVQKGDFERKIYATNPFVILPTDLCLQARCKACACLECCACQALI